MSRHSSVAIAVALLVACLCPGWAQEPAEESATHVTSEGIFTADGRAYVVYAEAMPGETWSEKINAAVQRALGGGAGGEVVLPPRWLEIDRPIKLWRQRTGADTDTRAEGVELGDLAAVYESIRGGRIQDLPRGLVLRGAAGGATRLIWTGGPNQVVIDLPAPWYCEVRNISIDGNNTEGLVGIRYRAGWEFGTNGGKCNLFEGIRLTRMDVGFHVGGPFGPDLVAGEFRNIQISAVREGFRFVGANVAEMWLSGIMITNYDECGFNLITHSGRVVRGIAERDTPTEENVLRDADGREIFLEQIPETAIAQKLMRTEHPGVEGSARRPWVGGGGPTVVIENVVAHAKHPASWLVKSFYAPVRLSYVRHEGPGGILKAWGGAPDGRFNDILVDVNAVTPGGLDGWVIDYDRPGPLYIMGGTFEGLIALGRDAVVYDMGCKFANHGRSASGLIGPEFVLPEGSFYRRTGEQQTWPERRWPGDVAVSETHDWVGYVQRPGTAGAVVYSLQNEMSLTVQVPEGETSVAVALDGMRRQPDAGYQVTVTPGWRAGEVWVTDKRPDGFTVNAANPAPEGASLDVVVRRTAPPGAAQGP